MKISLQTPFQILSLVFLISSCSQNPSSNSQPQVSQQSYNSASVADLYEQIAKKNPNAYLYVNTGNANGKIPYFVGGVLGIEPKYYENYTLLHYAVEKRDIRSVGALLDKGANPLVRTGLKGYKKETPARLALTFKQPELAAYIAKRSGEDFSSLLSDYRSDSAEAAASLNRTGTLLALGYWTAWQKGFLRPASNEPYTDAAALQQIIAQQSSNP